MLPYELDEVWEILREESPETWKVYCALQRHMDPGTGIAGISYRFNEQFFKDLLTPAAIQGRHKPKPPTRKKVRHLLHRLEQLGVATPKPDLGDFVFFLPKSQGRVG